MSISKIDNGRENLIQNIVIPIHGFFKMQMDLFIINLKEKSDEILFFRYKE